MEKGKRFEFLGTKEKLPVAEHLTDSEYKLFLEVYAKHNSSIELEQRAKYNLDKIVKVTRNLEDNCLNVYYENGDWWKYYSDYTWG